MRLSDLVESKQPLKESARITHLEDMIIWHGSQGVKMALDTFKSIQRDPQSVSIKWDGCVHPDTVLLTDCGEMTIAEVISRHTCGQHVKVLGHDFRSGDDMMIDVQHAATNDGDKPWVTIHLENGSIITLTYDHEVHTTNRGWIQAGELHENDDITEISEK